MVFQVFKVKIDPPGVLSRILARPRPNCYGSYRSDGRITLGQYAEFKGCPLEDQPGFLVLETP